MLASFIVWIGLATMVIGLLGVVHPIRVIRLTNRGRGAALVGVGTCLLVVGAMLPAPTHKVGGAGTRLDAIIPAYQFNEMHSLTVNATPERVYRAVRDVTAGEIALFHLLTSIRRFGRSTPESILNAPDTVPLIDVATRSGFLVLADEPPIEIVFGTVVLAPDGWRRAQATTPDAFVALKGDGFATAVMNFRIVPNGSGASVLTTETRVFATDAASARRFAIYWRVIRPGSAIIRRMWLRAIRRRASMG